VIKAINCISVSILQMDESSSTLSTLAIYKQLELRKNSDDVVHNTLCAIDAVTLCQAWLVPE